MDAEEVRIFREYLQNWLLLFRFSGDAVQLTQNEWPNINQENTFYRETFAKCKKLDSIFCIVNANPEKL